MSIPGPQQSEPMTLRLIDPIDTEAVPPTPTSRTRSLPTTLNSPATTEDTD